MDRFYANSSKESQMRLLNIVTSPRRERSASVAVIDSFLLEYQKRIKGVVVDTLDVWTESLPEFDAEAIGAKYKGVSGEAMTASERATWEKIRELASRFQKADRIVFGVPMWNFSFPYKLKQLIDLTCQRNMLFTFDGKEYGPALNIDAAYPFGSGQSRDGTQRQRDRLTIAKYVPIMFPWRAGGSMIVRCRALSSHSIFRTRRHARDICFKGVGQTGSSARPAAV
jgi:putative NADPH-quinone reductase